MIPRSVKEKLFFVIMTAFLIWAVVEAVTTGQWWLLLVIYAISSINGIVGNNIALHRYFSHGGFKTTRWKEVLLAWWSVLPGNGMGPIAFAGLHGHHHRYSDTARDVHSPNSHPWWYVALGLWILDSNREQVSWTRAEKRLLKDPVLKFIENNYFLIWFVLGVIITGLFGWTVALYGLLAPAGYWVIQGNLVTNFLGHYPITPGAYKTFDNNDNSTNNKFINWLTWGEGLQNNHHRKPAQYDHAMSPGEFDPSGWVVKKFFAVHE